MKKAKILMVTPNLRGFSDGVNRIAPSLGLMLIAQNLINDGHEVKMHDFALEGWDNRKVIDPINKVITIGQSDEDIHKVINNYSPDILMVSVLFSSLWESAGNIAKIAKKTNKNIKIIIGGNCISNAISDYKYAMEYKNTNLPDYINYLEDENFDYAMTGEGEFSAVHLVNAIINKTDTSKVPGLVLKVGPKKYKFNPPDRLGELNLLARPPRHLVNMEGYFKIGAFMNSFSKSKRVLSVMCSRGCPEKCGFCTTPEMWGASIRWRGTEHIMDEINHGVKEYNIGEIQFEDDSLTLNKKNLFALCKELEKLGIPWCTPNGTKVNYHLKEQYDMYKSMADSGCYQLTLACESGSQRVLDKIIDKRLPLETIYPAIENAKKAGMQVHTYWILGFPGETYEEIQKTVDFAMNSGADSFSFSCLQPLPGTRMYRQVMKENLWWPGRGLEQMTFRNSLVQVDGYKSGEEFQKFVDDTNIAANLLLKQKNSQEFTRKYGANVNNASLLHQN